MEHNEGKARRISYAEHILALDRSVKIRLAGDVCVRFLSRPPTQAAHIASQDGAGWSRAGTVRWLARGTIIVSRTRPTAVFVAGRARVFTTTLSFGRFLHYGLQVFFYDARRGRLLPRIGDARNWALLSI